MRNSDSASRGGVSTSVRNDKREPAMKPSQCDINLMAESASLPQRFVQLVHVPDAAEVVYRRPHNTVG